MALTTADVQKVAELARLDLSPDELTALTTQLSSILGYIEVLNEVDTTGVEPMVHAMELRNVFRDDVCKPSLPRSEALANAPKTDGKYFLVPTIVQSD